MKCLIFSHNGDYDGWTSAAVCDYFLRMVGAEPSIVGVDYGADNMPSIEELQELTAPFDFVFLCDFTFPPESMEMLLVAFGPNFAWIDHHKTAIEDSVGRYDTCSGLRSTDKAACELTFDYLINDFTNIGSITRSRAVNAGPPECITLLGRRDTFRKDETWETDVQPFHCFMTSRQSEYRIGAPEFTAKWCELFSTPDLVTGGIEIGREMMKLMKALDEETAADAHVVKFDDFPDMRFLAINGRKGTDNFASKDPEGFDGMVSYRCDGAEWSFGLYGWENSPDLSIIAKHFGGGGHMHAAGFRLPDLTGVMVSKLEKKVVEGSNQISLDHPFNVAWGER